MPGDPLNSAIVSTSIRELPPSRVLRRFTITLAAAVALPTILLAAFVVVVDPYYLFGSPSWPGVNVVRPYYELHVIAAKPYQMRRIEPSVVTLGSSRVEVGLDPRHPGWADRNVFNFGLPSATSYEVMLAYLHASEIARPLKQVVVGLDFFGFNIFFPRNQEELESRFAGTRVAAFADFLTTELAARPRREQRATDGAAPAVRHDVGTWNEALYLAIYPDVSAAVQRNEFKSGLDHYERAGRSEGRTSGVVPSDWNEAQYLKIYPDVAAAVRAGTFISGYHHYVLAGRREGREDGTPPKGWDEEAYLQVNRDVEYAISQKQFISGYHHYLVAGRVEKRLGGFRPPDWNEAQYLAMNPAARIRIALGDYSSGYAHFAAVGREQRLGGGFPPNGLFEKWSHSSGNINKAVFQLGELFRLLFSVTVLRDSVLTIARQGEAPAFDDRGMRVWSGHDETMRKLGGLGKLFHAHLINWRWYLWLMPPRFMYCFSNDRTGMTSFDAYRFMLRQAYRDGTDMRLFAPPLHPSVRTLMLELRLDGRYQFWMKQLVSINEEEARLAGRPVFPLWDFSGPSTITSEPVPAPSDPALMRWFFDVSHHRKAAGDLILDRVLGHQEPGRTVPSDFGVRLTGETVDVHLATSERQRVEWAAANSRLVEQIVTAAHAPEAQNRQVEATCW